MWTIGYRRWLFSAVGLHLQFPWPPAPSATPQPCPSTYSYLPLTVWPAHSFILGSELVGNLLPSKTCLLILQLPRD